MVLQSGLINQTHGPAFLQPNSGMLGEAKLDPEQADTSPGSASSIGNSRPVQPRVFARLQALLSPSLSSPQPHSAPTGSPSAVAPGPLPSSSTPRFIKVRIITWNMHDSLPKGDLEELLGSVPPHTHRAANGESVKMDLPGLSMEDVHPYHIIVVGGQECPTLSGIPLGLAANFKYKDARDRDKDKDKDKDKEKEGEKDREKDKLKDKDILHQILSKHLKHDHAAHSRASDSPPNDIASETSFSHAAVPTSGWSAVLEDWFVNGVGSLHNVKPVVAGIVPDSATKVISTLNPSNCAGGGAHAAENAHGKLPKSPPNHELQHTIDVNWKPYNASATGSDPSPTSDLRARMGPYELLVKERLMGIYTAVYVHRDIRSLVRGFSTSVVPAGLIGGRLGNKGGVGISVNIQGTTLLFINAHLAAHEGKVPLRVANLAKIKAELSVESFLSPDDPRTFAEDLTDRFDHTWIFGDLNFRLDISRLHADWLISRTEYAQAFAFDQLHRLMVDGDPAFSGFNEAAIDFPPTFKYDVLRTLKRDRYKARHSHKPSKIDLNGVEERDSEYMVNQGNLAGEEDDEGQDAPEDDDDTNPSPTNSPVGGGLTRSPRRPTPKFITQAALRAKATWVALLNPSRDSNAVTPSPGTKRPTSAAWLDLPGSSPRIKPNASASSLTPPILRRAASTKTSLTQRRHDDDTVSCDNEKGIYDSSSKKRVPSWCDRILWKTTVEPPEELESEPEVNLARRRGPANRLGQRFLQAFRPGIRHDSILADVPVVPDSGSTSTTLPLSPSTLHPSSKEVPMTSSPGLYQSKSLEPLPTSVIGSNSSPLSAGRFGRQRSASTTVINDQSVSRPQSMPVSACPPHLLPPRRGESDQRTAISSAAHSMSLSSPVQPVIHAAPKRWFFNLISRDYAPSFSSLTSVENPVSPPLRQRRKGDVICLNYRTLDDHQMRRLEARSDHRPVMGSYAIYV